ncbi:hypothetical protein NT2_17_00110 [Caenibius tardaugens NBRC 16725]|uniref:DUF2513 domain-containing protein n=1 Tax=Caenibius tardaugens NBRC 16725 TaxID=1219035 RepID=U3A0C1_9SPHN|nr:DUF2513 domain-containing protein [Caenibius tardaugens]AZI35289.1 DUF2513 domain-containing protein [Caenibius tardaugens NBRC 16725]GAD51094.1 hypothetical protein NT2_17_00110 [Caenibius tardaugens NBRC 16725]
MGTPLKRDMDFIRSLLLDIERGHRAFNTLGDDVADTLGIDPAETIPAEEAERLAYHLGLLEDAGFVEFYKNMGGIWSAKRITWNGHEFLDTVRDTEVWERAKAGAEKAGNASVSFLWELAKAYGKHVASERLGIVLT